MTKKVLFVVTGHTELGDTGEKTGWFCGEVSHPLEVVREAGFSVDFASPGGVSTEPDPGSLDRDDPANARLLDSEKDMQALKHPLNPASLSSEDYQAIFFAGGHGTMWDFPDATDLQKLAADIYESGGVVAAVCHGPAVLVNLKLSDNSYLVHGKEVAAFTDEEEKEVEKEDVVPFLLASRLQSIGAEHTKADNWEAHVVVSERLVTGQNPASAKGVGEKIVFLLNHADQQGLAPA